MDGKRKRTEGWGQERLQAVMGPARLCWPHLHHSLVPIEGNIADVAVKHEAKQVHDEVGVFSENQEAVVAVGPVLYKRAG